MINTRKITFLNSKPNCVCWYTGIPYIVKLIFYFWKEDGFCCFIWFVFILCEWVCDFTHTAEIQSQIHTNILITRNTSTIKSMFRQKITRGIVFAFFSLVRDQMGRVCIWNCDTHTRSNMHIAYIFRHIAIVIMETIQI